MPCYFLVLSGYQATSEGSYCVWPRNSQAQPQHVVFTQYGFVWIKQMRYKVLISELYRCLYVDFVTIGQIKLARKPESKKHIS